MSTLYHLGTGLFYAAALVPALTSTPASGLTPLPRMRCEIRIIELPGGVQLEPIAVSTAALAGEYEFVVAKNGSGGSSVTEQGGEFTAEAGKPVVLSTASVEGGGSLQAKLTLSWNDGSASCEKNYVAAR